MSKEEEPLQTGHISGYDSQGPLTSHPAPYCHHGDGGSPKARLGEEQKQTIKTMFKNGTLTSLGKRIVEACPYPNSAGIDESTLIGKLNGMDAYADFQRDIASLIKADYLTQDPSTGNYKRVN